MQQTTPIGINTLKSRIDSLEQKTANKTEFHNPILQMKQKTKEAELEKKADQFIANCLEYVKKYSNDPFNLCKQVVLTMEYIENEIDFLIKTLELQKSNKKDVCLTVLKELLKDQYEKYETMIFDLIETFILISKNQYILQPYKIEHIQTVTEQKKKSFLTLKLSQKKPVTKT